MKFAKELDAEAVPEWKNLYLDYKQCKKLIKTVARAAKSTNVHPPPLQPPSPSGTPLLLPQPALATQRSNTSYGTDNVALHSRLNVEEKTKSFRQFLDDALTKVDSFFAEKEKDASEQLQNLRDQLHLMRDQQAWERATAERNPPKRTVASQFVGSSFRRRAFGSSKKGAKDDPSPRGFPTPSSINRDPGRDYVRKAPANDVPYKIAKHKLKVAMIEYYRSLELLKSYAFMNHKAFRKANKKYDKAVRAAEPLQYFKEKVNTSHFARSEVPDQYMRDVEDMYARYFEAGNHKIAAGKLRRKSKHITDFSGISFINGILAASGLVLAIQGLVGAIRDLGGSPVVATDATSLIQIYAGYFLLLLLAAMFAFDCWVFDRWRINYTFIFELNPRHSLDWRQLFFFPSACLCLLGLVMFLNFNHVGGMVMYVWWPWIMIGLTVLAMFAPVPYGYHHTRLWFGETAGRLFTAPLHPVAFGDFFLGDMVCSHTYAMGNIAIIFCLSGTHWQDPPSCNSSHNWAVGALTALPALFRLLQCCRRFADTGDWYPHMANAGKYGFNMSQYLFLSAWRISRNNEHFALFIAFSVANSIYSSLWDVVMDFSLGHRNMQRRWARDHIAFPVWTYAVIMALDPLMRFAWIFYVIFRNDIQHSSLVAFLVALIEVVRRGIWVLFRVENEHCANLRRNKASADLVLPYAMNEEEESIPSEIADHEPQSEV